ncbi:MAG: YqgE/AlgH family protein [Planctomycetota bacterium]|nr:YqgE/AlgH family protein [Planctomycetota bacterium]
MADAYRIDAGGFLCAWPDLVDPNFFHRVLLMCQHGDEGAFGLIVNEPLEVTTRELLTSHPVFGSLDFPVFRGGPVDVTTLQYLHRIPAELPGAEPVGEDVWLGGDFEALARYVARAPERALGEVRLFLGYSGWGAGQLEAELRTGSWVPATCGVDEVFSNDPEGAWQRVLRSLGDVGEGLSSMPPGPDWN